MGKNLKRVQNILLRGQAPYGATQISVRKGWLPFATAGQSAGVSSRGNSISCDLCAALGVPGRPLGNPPVVVFNLGRGGVPRGRSVAGQLRGTLMRVSSSPAGTSVTTSRVACSRQKVSRWSPTRGTSFRELHTSRQGGAEGSQGQSRFERRLHLRPMGAGSPRIFGVCQYSTSHPQHVSHRIADSPWRPASPSGSRLQVHGYRC